MLGQGHGLRVGRVERVLMSRRPARVQVVCRHGVQRVPEGGRVVLCVYGPGGQKAILTQLATGGRITASSWADLGFQVRLLVVARSVRAGREGASRAVGMDM